MRIAHWVFSSKISKILIFPLRSFLFECYVHAIWYNVFTFQICVQLIQSADKMTIRFDFFQQMLDFKLI